MTTVSTTAESSRAEYGRPASIEERSNRFFFHPLSGLVEKAAISFGVSANQVSLLGLASGWLAAVLYYQQPDQKFVIAGFLAMAAWHVFDGADGRIARATGKSSAFGRVIDGICDHLVFAAVYISITLHLINSGSPKTIWFLVVAAGVSHAVQAAGYEERRQRYQRRSKGINRHAANENLLEINGKRSLFAGAYDWIQKFVSGDPAPLDQTLDKLRAHGTHANIIQSALNRTALVVRRWSLLNANNRTFMIALMVFFGQPVFYFAYEVVVLNAVLLALLIHERRIEATIVSDLAPTLDQN
jgi:CDP-diacylglycerol---serine O-phosphatidyltransferase